MDFLKPYVDDFALRMISYIAIAGVIYLIYTRCFEGFESHYTIDPMIEMGSLTNPSDKYTPQMVATHPVRYKQALRTETLVNPPQAQINKKFVTDVIFNTNQNSLNKQLPGINQRISKSPQIIETFNAKKNTMRGKI